MCHDAFKPSATATSLIPNLLIIPKGSNPPPDLVPGTLTTASEQFPPQAVFWGNLSCPLFSSRLNEFSQTRAHFWHRGGSLSQSPGLKGQDFKTPRALEVLIDGDRLSLNYFKYKCDRVSLNSRPSASYVQTRVVPRGFFGFFLKIIFCLFVRSCSLLKIWLISYNNFIKATEIFADLKTHKEDT